jgi:hypothetical protein
VARGLPRWYKPSKRLLRASSPGNWTSREGPGARLLLPLRTVACGHAVSSHAILIYMLTSYAHELGWCRWNSIGLCAYAC